MFESLFGPLERLIANKIAVCVGFFIEDIDEKAFTLSLVDGQIHMENLKIKRELFDDLGLPIRLVQ
eukprot:Pgem_evm1s19562